MKALKKADYIVQIVLLGIAVLSVAALGFEIEDGPAIPMYFIVGGWQMISVIAHLFVKKEFKIKLRIVYQVLLIATMATGFLSAFNESTIYYLMALLFWAPVLAVLYVVCCYLEVQKLSQPAAVAQVDIGTKREL